MMFTFDSKRLCHTCVRLKKETIVAMYTVVGIKVISYVHLFIFVLASRNLFMIS